MQGTVVWLALVRRLGGWAFMLPRLFVQSSAKNPECARMGCFCALMAHQCEGKQQPLITSKRCDCTRSGVERPGPRGCGGGVQRASKRAIAIGWQHISTDKTMQFVVFCTILSVCLKLQKPSGSCLRPPWAPFRNWALIWQWPACAARNLYALGQSDWESPSPRFSVSKPATRP